MSKRKVQFAESTKLEDGTNAGGTKRTRQVLTKGDGDADKSERDAADYDGDLGDSGSEGEGGEEGGVMNMEDLEVEEKTVEYDEEVKITPFNLDEEMEEGHFDKDGTFVFDKKSNVKDSWLDEFDFNDVRQLESARIAEEKKQAKNDDGDAEHNDEKMSDVQIYEAIVVFLQAGENILRAVRRLGNATKSLSASERLKLKKLAAKQAAHGNSVDALPNAANVDEQKKQLARLTELADLLIRRGHMNAYEETYESLQFQLKHKKIPAKAVPAGDMFSDDFVEESNSKPTAPVETEGASNKDTGSSDNEVKWEYKMSTEDDGVIHGPVVTTILMNLISSADKDGQQASSFYVRRAGTSGQFYNSSRVDFSLYID